VRRTIVATIGALLVLAGAAGAQQHVRLFPPENLGVLEGPDRDSWQRPDQIMDALRIAEGSMVADLGAGSGWFTVRLGRRVWPNGMVYAEDIQRQMIDAITRRVARENLSKVVTPVLGESNDPKLPHKVDAVLIVEAYHEMDQPVILLKNVARYLNPGGRIGIVEFTREGGGPGPEMDDRVDPERVIRDAEAAGFVLESREHFLRYQYMLVFVPRR
jgi:predicted methyltransferase